nr:hypothetical protein [Tanacetum cinerariifolium]
ASSEVEILSDMPVTKNVVKRKQDKPDKGSGSNSELFLDQLGQDLTGIIILMLGKMWDVSAVTDRYLSTNFIVLKEGGIYSVKNFTVKPNKDEYRILKNDAYMLEFDGSTTIRKASVKADGFVKYPFQLQDFDDVAGYVTNVRRTNHLKSGSKNMDFHLAKHKGQSIRVTLWGSLRDVLIEKKPNRLVCAQLFYLQLVPKNKVYLSSTSSTVIYDDDAIPAIKALKKANSVIDHRTSGTSVDPSQPWTRTLENHLMWAWNRKNDSITFHCKVTIDEIGTKKGGNFPSCGSNTCTSLKLTCQTTPLRMLLLCSMKLLLLWSTVLQTPSWIQWMRIDVEDSETEGSIDSANATGKKGAVEPSAKKRKNRPTQHRGPKIIKLGAAAAG